MTMDSVEGGGMGFAQVTTHDEVDLHPSTEARRREVSARVTDLAFWIRKAAPDIDSAAAFAFGRAVVAIEKDGGTVSADALRTHMLDDGCTAAQVDEVFRAILER